MQDAFNTNVLPIALEIFSGIYGQDLMKQNVTWVTDDYPSSGRSWLTEVPLEGRIIVMALLRADSSKDMRQTHLCISERESSKVTR